MSSMMPWGKLGAEPTRRTVLLLMRRVTVEIETRYFGLGQGIRWTLILKYSAALRKAVCAVSGRILMQDQHGQQLVGHA